MQNLMIAVNCIVPFLVYMCFGAATRKLGIVEEAFLKKLSQLIFKVFFPIMMFYNLYSVKFSSAVDVKLLAVILISLLILFAILMLVVPVLVKEDPKRGVIIQAIFRSNILLFAVPLTASVFGEEYVAVPTLVIAFVIPVYNIMAVVCLETFRGGKAKLSGLILKIFKNPLIIGCMLGALFCALRIPIPACIDKSLKAMTATCTPLGMFVLGGILHFSQIKKDAKYLFPAMAFKMIAVPSVLMIVCTLLGFNGLEKFIVMIIYATPISTNSYPMAQNMGGDDALAGEFVAVSTGLSIVTLFAWIYVMSAMGMLAIA